MLESSIVSYMFNNLEGEVAWDWLILCEQNMKCSVEQEVIC